MGGSAPWAYSKFLAPWLDLAVRLWLAQAFLAVQITGLMLGHGIGAPLGASWWVQAVHAVTASGLGLAVQAACPLLLAPGLLARPAAAAMLLQLAVSQAADMPMMAPSMILAEPGAALLWAVLLARIVVVGPGTLSFDHLLRRGAQSSAVPGLAALAVAYRRGRRWLGPWVALLLRLWLAAGPAIAALAAFGLWPAMRSAVTPFLPQLPAMVAHLPPIVLGLLGLLLIAGAATPVAVLVLLALVPFGALTGAEDARLFWALLCALVAVHGAGALSVDAAAWAWLHRRRLVDRSALPHVVVVGGGFGGVAAVAGLRGAPCRITLIDRHNYHLFQPLLYQVATAGLSPADIATPVRSLFRAQPNVRVRLGEVTGIDAAECCVQLGAQTIGYDVLVVATGARHSYFGREDWAARAPGLKSIEDGTAIRARLLDAFEAAETVSDDAARRACLTFVIVGGGPTGVELAGAIAELARHGMADEFREIDPADAAVILVQSGPRLLPTFPEPLSRAATRALLRLGVEVRTDARVEAVDAQGVTISGTRLAARTVLWAAGVMASPAAQWLGVTPDRAGRVEVREDLTVAGQPDIFVIGDTAASRGWSGRDVPGLAPAAKQGGAYVARVIRARLAGRPPPGPFRYRHLGSLATVGRQEAVADFGLLRVSGAFAWWLWGAAHVVFLVGGRNRVSVLVEWLWAYLTYRRGSRLITDSRA